MESFLRGKDADRILQDKLVTTRNDRYVLLLKAEHRGQLPGHHPRQLRLGRALFVEPMPAVELNNDIVALAEEERREVVRILRELTSRVGARADELAPRCRDPGRAGRRPGQGAARARHERHRARDRRAASSST